VQDLQRVRELGRRERVLVQVPDGACVIGPGNVAVLVGAGVDHNVLRRVARVDRTRRVDTVATGQADVHQDDVGLVLGAESHRVVAGSRAADDGEASIAVEDRPDQRGQVIVVLGEQDA
jgi:hypothetical protein